MLNTKKEKYKIFIRDTQVSLFPVCLIVDAWNIIYPKLFGYQPRMGLLDRRKQLDYFISQKEYDTFQQILTDKVKNDPNYLDDLIKRIRVNIDELNQFTQTNIYQKDLSSKTNNELFELFDQFCQIDIECYALGNQMFVLEFGQGYWSGQIRNILSQRVKNEDLLTEYYTTLTNSTRKTQIYRESFSLLKLADELYQSSVWSKIQKSDPENALMKIEKNIPKFYQKLQNHREQYLHVFYNWEGPALTVYDFYLNIVDILSSGNPAKKLFNKQNALRNLIKRQNKIFHELNFSKEEKRIVKTAGEIAFWQLHRKTMQWKSGWQMEWLLSEIAKRLSISMDQVRYLLKSELKTALDNGKVDFDLLNERADLLAYYYEGQKPILISGQEVKNFIDEYIIEDQLETGLTELSGTPASLGKTSGTVRIVNTIEEAKQMQKGEILVSYATSPLIVSAMRLASAILTQEGGLTCHAAIVSRELNVPCIVGVKNLIANLKNGDKLQVNANKGVIRKIK